METDEQKYQKRATAYKFNIEDINKSQLINGDFGQYFSNYNLKIKRVRIMATVIEKREFEGGENLDLSTSNTDRSAYGFLVLDDGTGTIRLKVWKENVKMLYDINIGDIVDTVSILRKYQDEIYLSPEFITKIEDPNWELLRELEIIQLKKIYPLMSEEQNHKIEKKSVKSNKEKIINDEIGDANNLLENKILNIIKSSEDSEGISRDELYKILSNSKFDIDESLKELINKGKIVEHTTGKIKAT
ncbi:MAG: OB-fold nucleic acid binding domain-containing protein [Candidatus Helarchaeota archaeon]